MLKVTYLLCFDTAKVVVNIRNMYKIIPNGGDGMNEGIESHLGPYVHTGFQ